jgi:hypothetical protein
VEERLLEQKRKYEANAEQRRRERLLEELYQMREAPEINPVSEQLARGERVEDRLLKIGRMWKERKESKQSVVVVVVD